MTRADKSYISKQELKHELTKSKLKFRYRTLEVYLVTNPELKLLGLHEIRAKGLSQGQLGLAKSRKAQLNRLGVAPKKTLRAPP